MLRVLCVFCLVFPLAAQTLDQVRKDFANPPKSARPAVRWWWPGGDVDPAELRREIDAMDEAWIGGAEIQPFRIGLKRDLPADALNRINDYPTPSFYQKVRAALEEARERGMFIDLTLGSGWPFGGGEAITPELASLELRSTYRSVQGLARFHEKLVMPPAPPGMGALLAKMTGTSLDMPSGWKDRLAARTKIVAVVAVRGSAPEVGDAGEGVIGMKRISVKTPGKLDTSSAVVLTGRIQPDGTLDWDVPEGQWQIFLFERRAADLAVIGGVGVGPQLVLDHMNRAALEAHLNRIAGPASMAAAEFFGKTLRAGFCDSLEVTADLFWSESFLDEFKRRRGYDLTAWLPVIKQPGFAEPYGAYQSAPLFDGEGAAKARRDYWRTVSDLWIDNFFQPMQAWARQRGLKTRVQSYGAPVDVMRAWSISDIPETEQLYAGGRIDFLKAAVSAGHVYGKRLISSESFVHMGMAYKSTPESLLRDTNQLIAAGVNQIFYHGFPYVYMDRPEPGWHPFASPLPFSDHFNPHAKIWSEVPRLNRYITRLQYVSQNSRPLVKYLIYRPQLDYPNISGGAEPATRDYDYINEEALLRCHVRKGRLLAPSGMEYEVLVLRSDDAALRRRFKGGKVLVGEVPADDAPTRWQLAGAEFQFHFNSSATTKKIALPAGGYETWDAFTGETAPYPGKELTLAPGEARLLVKTGGR